MNDLLRPRIWPSFRASSGVEPCDVPFRYASDSIPRYRGTVARWHARLHGLATAIHETSGLDAYNEPHPGGIQRKTQGKGYLGFWIADFRFQIELNASFEIP